MFIHSYYCLFMFVSNVASTTKVNSIAVLVHTTMMAQNANRSLCWLDAHESRKARHMKQIGLQGELSVEKVQSLDYK